MHTPAPSAATRRARHYTSRVPVRPLLAAAALCVGLGVCAASTSVHAQTAAAAGVSHAAEPAQRAPEQRLPVSDQAVAEGHTAEEQHGAAWLQLAGKVFNFAVLAGLLVYFLREPIRRYLADRGTQIRTDLVTAATMKEEASRQIAEIDGKLKQLPRELDALRAHGQEEIAAEQARIEQAAAAERDRLMEQARRDIDLQVRAARRELVTHAADLAVQVARERIRTRITDDDQRRLVDRYLGQVSTHE